MSRSTLLFRVGKITLASLAAMVSAHLLGIDYPLFPAMAACFCISPTFQSSLKRFEMEIKLTVFATLIALGVGGIAILEHDLLGGFSRLAYLDYLLTALSMGIVVMVVQYFGWQDALFVGLLTVPYVILMPVESPGSERFLSMGMIRLGSILLGSGIALIVDFLFSGYEYSRLVHHHVKQALVSIETMLDLFVEAIMFRSGEMADRILDQSVASLNQLDRIKRRLDDLEWEMDLRGEDIHGFNRSQHEILRHLLQDLRLTCFQLESGAINYMRLTDVADRMGQPIPETDYAEFSVKGRKLARVLEQLQNAVTREDAAPLSSIPSPEDTEELDYTHLFEDLGDGDVRLLAVDTMAAIHRIEHLLCVLAGHLREYYGLRGRKTRIPGASSGPAPG